MTERKVSSERVSGERLESFIKRCDDMSEDGQFAWWSELASILRDYAALRSSEKTVGPTPDQVLDAANDYAMEQYGMGFLNHPVDRQRILSAVEAPAALKGDRS